MKVALTAAVISALLIAAAESLDCVQCTSWSQSCDADQGAEECPSDTSDTYESCVSSSANFSLGEFVKLYQDMSCWVQNCVEGLDPFTVHVASGEYFYFASQCCQGEPCENAPDTLASAPGDGSSNTQCPSCFGLNTTSCTDELRTCSEGQQCVQLEVEFTSGTELQNLVVKGCSDISDSTCEFLSLGNQEIGDIVFVQANCTDALEIPTTRPTTRPTTPSSASLTACLASWGLGSLLLLGLLL